MAIEPRAGAVPFDEAIAFLRGRLGTRLPSRTWTDTYGRLNSVGFAVAGAWKDALLEDLGNAVLDLMTSGRPAKSFEADLARIATAHQWNFKGNLAWRAKVIAETNLRGAYAAGKWQQARATQADFPFLRYVAVLDDRTRLQHRVWHGTILTVDHPWWNTHFPPNGWGCRCTVQQVDSSDLLRNGWKITDPAPATGLQPTPVDPRRSVQRKLIPAGIDPGFEHNPGKVLEAPFMPQLVDDLGQGFVGRIARRATEKARDDAVAAGAVLPQAIQAFAPAPPSMPAPRPFDPAKLLPANASDADAMAAFLSRFGASAGRAVIVQPPGGGALAVGEQMFVDAAGKSKLPKDMRAPYMPMLAEALADPDEVWAALEWHVAMQRVIVRRRYLARFIVGGQMEATLATFEWTGALWRGVTTFAPRAGKASAQAKENYLANAGRQGVLVYQRK